MIMKRNTNRFKYSKKRHQSGGSSLLRSTTSSIKSVVKKLYNKHKTGLKQLDKLSDMITHIKTTYRTMLTLHNNQIRKYNSKAKSVNQSTTTSVKNERVKINVETMQNTMSLINHQRMQLNFLRMLTIKLRCVILKYILTNTPNISPDLFQEYSLILDEIKKIYKKNDLVNMALIKELYDFYKNNNNEYKHEFNTKLRRLLNIEKKELAELERFSNSEMMRKLKKKCSEEDENQVRISNLSMKLFKPFDPNKSESNTIAVNTNIKSSILNTITVENSIAGRQKSKKSKKSRKKRRKLIY